MQVLDLRLPKLPAHPADSPRRISPWLSAAADIYLKYFSDKPTKLTMQEVKDEIIREYVDLPLRDIATILVLVDTQFAVMSAKKQDG